MPPLPFSLKDSSLLIPAELRALKQWVARSHDKKPFTAPGRMASSTDPSTWLTFDEAVALAAREKLAGIGFVFAATDPYAGIDLDKCRDVTTGNIQPWAQRLIERFASYTEMSPSGTGVHIIVKATLPGPGRKRNRPDGVGAVEMYDRARYFTMTGDAVNGVATPIEERQATVADVYARLGSEAETPAASAPVATGSLTPEDHTLIEAIESSKDATAWHRLFVAGETRPGHSGSENDHELAAILCRYTADDATVERLMRASPLHREKWDRRGDPYLARTIAGARRKTGTVRGVDTKEAAFVDFGAVHDAPPPAIGWLVEDIWPQGARGWIGGEAKLGKSWLALELAVSVASGTPFLGKHEVTQSGKVFYLTEESNLRAIYTRLRMILLAKGLEPNLLRGQLHLLVRQRVKLTDPRWATRILTAIDREKPVAVFLDPLRRYHDGGENDSADLVAVLDAAASFQERPGDHRVAVPIVHHMRKSSEANADARAGQQLRGSSDLHAWGDAALYCTGTSEDKNAMVVEVELKDAESPPSFVVGIEYGEPQTVEVGRERTEMKPALLRIRDGQASKEDIKIRAVADRVLAFLAQQSDRQSVGAIKSGVAGRDKLIAPALSLLERERKADKQPGPRNTQLWAVVGAPPPPTTQDLPF
jgi:AAA domain-containing protein/primase/DNA polymerase family protein